MLTLFEDEHLLVIDKPAGVNTHAPSPYAGEGIYDWLRHREPRWSSLAIIHRLDKETSGIMVFGKTPRANRSLTQQFEQRLVTKKYVLVTDRPVKSSSFTARSVLIRAGEKYLSRPLQRGGEVAETTFKVLWTDARQTIVEAQPLTGRTHQIRVHAAEHGFPIIGDQLYGGAPGDRLWLHAEELSFAHPQSNQPVGFRAAADFNRDWRESLREAVIDREQTTACRLIHGASDKWPGWHVDRLGDFLLSQSETPLGPGHYSFLRKLLDWTTTRGVYHKELIRRARQSGMDATSPKLLFGDAAPHSIQILENGIRYELSFEEGYSVGLFLDQRDNRRRFLVNHVAAGFPLFASGLDGREVLNTFAYTCGFSVGAARAGARVTSLDLSKKYLEWGKRNFVLNQIDPARHDFFFGEAFDWMRRMAKKQRRFDAVILDPPTFSKSKQSGVFRVEKDYAALITSALELLKPGGILFASANAAKWAAEDFVACVKSALASRKRRLLQVHYAPQPPDFPVTKSEPAYLKTLWLKVE